jgi:hypothetical protein
MGKIFAVLTMLTVMMIALAPVVAQAMNPVFIGNNSVAQNVGNGGGAHPTDQDEDESIFEGSPLVDTTTPATLYIPPATYTSLEQLPPGYVPAIYERR